MIKLERVQQELDRLEAEYIEKLRAYMTPIIQAEFDRVRKRNHKLEYIIFGMGDYAFGGFTGFDRYCPADYDHAPKYMQKLILLCDMVSSFGIDDIYPF